MIPRTRAVLAIALLCTACGGPDTVPGYSRETGPDGTVTVSYADGLPVAEDTLVALFEIGRYVTDTSTIFEDLRDIAVDGAGRIHVLDYQAAHIRVFRPDGTPDTTLARRGEGPGELGNANGMRFGPDGTLWVNDHSKRMLLALNADGTERVRVSSIVPGFGYRWGVTIDTAGVMWEPWSRMITGPAPDMSATGIVEGTSQALYLMLDPASERRDSVALGVSTFRNYRAAYPGGGGQSVFGLPYASRGFMQMDRHRRVWTVAPGSYSLVRGTVTNDTTLVVAVAEDGLPVTEEDIAGWREGMASILDKIPGLESDLMGYMPERKAPIREFFIDATDRLWVGRGVPTGEPPRWDVFSAEGEFLAAVRAPAGITATMQPLVQGNRIYLLPTGEAGERYVVVAELPAALRGAR